MENGVEMNGRDETGKWDQIKIDTTFMNGFVSRIVNNFLKEKGYDIDFQISRLKATNKSEGSKAQIHLDLDVELDAAAFNEILKNDRS